MMWIATLLGGVLVLVAWRDVFTTLWHPSGRGPVGTALMRVVWRLSGRLGTGGRRLSGPVAMVLVIVTWAALLVVGCALVYWPHLPERFSYGPGLLPGERNGFIDALYVSLVALTTLGLGDIVPTGAWLRLLVPLEALLGFALLTAAVSWVLQVYPALTRRRVLSLRLDALRRARTTDALPGLQASTTVALLAGVADAVGKVHVDLLQYSETYYFRDADARTTLAVTVPYAVELARTARASENADVRHAAAVLSEVIDDLATVLGEQFLHADADTAGILAAYRRDQSVRSPE
ncbi:potassium channel family protein [Georgenia sp. MJ173]|uniref:potassium channel family protein n=1 Tax=Georgenia sunbinii TaxID=3117728 RepID=UPI002F26DBDF